jgi:hypothetical protein
MFGITLRVVSSGLIAAAALLPVEVRSAGAQVDCSSPGLGAEPAVLGVKTDSVRGRVWILGGNALYLYQTEGQRVRRFDLPNWRYVAQPFACPPDFVVESQGTVLVSSNITPTLWRVDPDSGVSTELPIQPLHRQAEDFGFAALEVSPRDVVWARGAADRSRWVIDLKSLSATLVADDRAR